MRKEQYKISKIFVTGGNGFIGKHLLRKLEKKGYKITCMQRESGMKVEGFSNINESEIMNLGFSPDVVIHLAGLAHISSRYANKKGLCFQRSNNELTSKVVDFARLKNVKIFINISSIAVVSGASSEQIIDDSSTFIPRSPYAKSKYYGERHVKTLKQNDCLAISLRPPLIIGQGAKGNWAKLISIASTGLPLPFKNINNHRSFIGIDDLCDRILTILSQEPIVDKSGEYCVASSPPLTTPEIIHEIRALNMKADRMFSAPDFVWKALSKIPKISQLLEKITGDLVLDDTQFCSVFMYRNAYPVKQQIRKSMSSDSFGDRL